MVRMTTDAASRRETLTLPAQEARMVDRLMDAESLERWALEQLAGGVGTAKAAVLRAAFHVGIDRIQELAMDEGYRRLAESTTEQEAAEDRAITRSRRRRQRREGDDA
jgi:urease accessory protein UreF